MAEEIITNPNEDSEDGVEEIKDETTVEVKEEKPASPPVDPNVGKPQATTTSTPVLTGLTQEEKDAATSGLDKQIKIFEDALSRYSPPESKEDREKREKRERSQKIVAAISDGIQAVSNLWFTSQYAPNAYNHDKQSMMKSQDERFQKLKAEREANDAAYYNYAIQGAKAAGERAKTLRELQAQHEAQRLARAEAARKEEARAWARALQLDKQREQKGKADKAEQDYYISKIKAESAPGYQELVAEEKRASINQKNAAANRSNAGASADRSRAGYYDRGGRSRNGGSFNVEDADGNVRTIEDKDLDREFSALPSDKRMKAGNESAYGVNQPTSEQKRQAIAEHERTQHRKGNGVVGKKSAKSKVSIHR